MTLVSSPAASRERESGLTTLAQAVGPLAGISNLPLYQQLQRALREAIDRRILEPNDALPPERDLAEEFGVSRITVRKAIDGLVTEGLLVRRQGSGTFVAARVEKNFSQADLVLGGHARARPHSAQRLAQARERHGDAGRIADAALEPGHAGVPVPPHALRRRRADVARIRDGRRLLPAVARSRGHSLYEALERAATARCARCSACAPCC